MTPSSLKPLVRLRSSLLHLYEVQNKHCSDQLLAYMPRGTLSGLRIASGRFLWLDCSKLRPLAPQIDKYSIGLGLTISLYLPCISHASRYTRDTTRLRDPKRSNHRLSVAKGVAPEFMPSIGINMRRRNGEEP